ncbi:Chaperone protein dnaJ 11 chloroplastic [Bienertia sinuspersici]
MMQTLSFPGIPATTPLNRRFRCRAAVQSLSPATLNSSSLYEVLRVNRNASPLEIKAAYRSLAKLYHPDSAAASSSSSSSSSDGCDFIQIHNAYETLSDPSARALYDLSLGFGIGIGIGIGMTEANHNSNSPFSTPFRWETDQCW